MPPFFGRQIAAKKTGSPFLTAQTTCVYDRDSREPEILLSVQICPSECFETRTQSTNTARGRVALLM